MIDPELRDMIAPELAEGEELLWAGRPNMSLTAARVFALLGPLMFVAIAIWVYQKVGFGLIFLFVLILALIALRAWYSPLKEVYAITDRQVLIFDRTLLSITHKIKHTDIETYLHGTLYGLFQYEENTIKLYSQKRPKLIAGLFSRNGQMALSYGSVFFLRSLSNAEGLTALLDKRIRDAS